jgi:CDP-diacylglycerol---glycerol-3-phosphate 3-phosphatidyltransferase
MPIAHYFTFIRIFISPIFLLIYLYYRELGISPFFLPIVLGFLLGVSELSDACDGYLARKYNQVTDLGKILDPMADSIYRISVFLTFTLEPVRLPMGLVFVFLYRDSVVSTLRTICALKGLALAARPSGKIKAVIQAIGAFCILCLMLLTALDLLSSQELTTYSSYVIGVAGFYTLFSGFDYIFSNRVYIKRILSSRKKRKAQVMDG